MEATLEVRGKATKKGDSELVRGAKCLIKKRTMMKEDETQLAGPTKLINIGQREVDNAGQGFCPSVDQ